MRALRVFIGQRLVGELLENNDLWGFDYAEEWQAAPDGFSLSPAISRRDKIHRDGATQRPVQWYFDNLLPEEQLRTTIAQEAKLPADDAFALLEWFGAESAGSLTLVLAGEAPSEIGELRPLDDAELSQRIAHLPDQSLMRQAPKRMSLAGAQHKLLVVARGAALFEPVGETPSTHILKPEHPLKATYPASVFNEYLTMKLAGMAGLDVPDVQMRFVPQPVYIIRRFDRSISTEVGAEPVARRLHIIDACQLLNKARTFKHSGATVAALRDIVAATTNKAATRQRLFSWLAFNTVISNDDCHLKNLSFLVDHDGIALAPHYDLLSTGAYHTKALADGHATWPNVPMAIPLPGAKTFGEVTAEKLLRAADELELPRAVATRLLTRMKSDIQTGLWAIKSHHEQLMKDATAELAPAFAQSSQLLRVIEHITLPHMLKLLG